jgi:hypothetical protein
MHPPYATHLPLADGFSEAIAKTITDDFSAKR